MYSCTVGALALRPTGNRQGGYYFFSLYSGRRIHRTHWTVLPMTEEVKNRLLFFCQRGKAQRGLIFHDGEGRDINDPSD